MSEEFEVVDLGGEPVEVVDLGDGAFEIVTPVVAGARGPRGLTGAQGDPGSDGNDGAEGPAGDPGTDGREVEIRNDGTHVQWRYVGDPSWTDVVALSVLTGPAGADGSDGAPGAPGAPGTPGSPGASGADGADGREVELQKTATYIQWRYVGAGSWTNLVALSAITGPAGADGAPGAPGASGSPGADGADGSDGADGRGITSIARTSGTGAAGTTDTYTITYSDATTSTFAVVNGANGATGSPGSPGATGAAGADGKTVRSGSATPSSGLGVDGDFYINTAANTIYGPKTSGAWGSATSLVGPAGSAGAPGATGATGPSGVVAATAPATYNSGTQTIGVTVGTGASTVAAGDDSRITGAAQKASNLSDLASASTARTNLGLGTAAVKNTGTSSGDVPLLSTGGLLPIARIASGTPDGTKFVRDDGTLVTPAGGGSVATDAIFDAKGDLAVGTGADTAAKLTVGSTGQAIVADSTQTTGVKWATPPWGGGDYFKSGSYYVGGFMANSSTTALSLSVAVSVPYWVPVRRAFDRIGINVTTAATAASGGVLRLGIYADAGGPGALIVDVGTISSESTGAKELTISQTLDPGLYWLVIVPQVAACSVSGHSLAAVQSPFHGWATPPTTTAAAPSRNSVTGALPNPFAASGLSSNQPTIALRAV